MSGCELLYEGNMEGLDVKDFVNLIFLGNGKMNKISKMIVVFVMCGVMVASAQAALEIVSNPQGLSLTAVTADGINAWDWASDTLGTAYANGQLDVVTPSPVVFGVAENMVDGAGDGAGLIMYNQFTATFTLNSSYDGPRALGTIDGQWGHAMRIGISFHESYNNYHLVAYYQTTDAPGVWQTLFEVKDLDTQPAWKATGIYVNTDAASMAIENINAIAIKSYAVLQTGGATYGADIKELDVNLMAVPEPATMCLLGIGSLLMMKRRK